MALVVLCSTSGDFALIDSFDVAESLPKVFWKKSKMLAELLRSSHALCLGVWFLPTAADVLSLSELVKYLDCTGLEVLPWDPVVTTDETLEWFVMSGLGLGVLGEEVKWLFCCFWNIEEAEAAFVEDFGDISESLLVSDFLRLVLLKRSSMELCLILSPPWLLLLLWDFGIFTGEPFMLTKWLALPTDLFTGGFFPMEVDGLTEVKVLEIPLVLLEWTGEETLLVRDDGVKNFFGEGTGLDNGVFTTGSGGLGDGKEDVESWDFPPRMKPFPLNGMMFLISCDPEPGTGNDTI